MVSSISIGVGRFLLGLYFFVPGLMKLADPAGTIAYMEAHSIALAMPLMWFATATNIVGGLLLMSGRHIKFVAYGFALYVILVNVMLHNFWAMSGDMVAHETQNFIKNLGIFAGLLVLAGHAPLRALSPKGWWRSDKAMSC